MRIALLLGFLGCCYPTAVGAEETLKPASDADRVRNAFQEVARKVYEEIFSTLSEANRHELERVLGCAGAECAAKAAEFLVASSGAFEVTPDEAKKILEGRFDDKANAGTAQSCAKRLSTLGMQPPYLFAHLVEKLETNKIESGIELEFAARLLAHHTARAQRVAEATRAGTRAGAELGR